MTLKALPIFACLGILSCVSFAADAEFPEILTKVALGSCNRTSGKSEEAFSRVAAQKPQVMLMLGDNIYADTLDPAVMKQKYADLGNVNSWKELNRISRVLAVWDDHDYGQNDAGEEYPMKEESKKIFMEFFKVPEKHAMNKRGGVYQSAMFGPLGKRVQVILLDARSFRSPLKRENDDPKGACLPDPDPKKTMLGSEQWGWLIEQLKEPADLRLIGSGIQILPEEHRFEKWANFPLEKKRLLDLAAVSKGKIVFLSGDRHMAEISRISHAGKMMAELTSSGLTNAGAGKVKGGADEPNRHRVGKMVSKTNSGLVQIDWTGKEPKVSLEIHSGELRVPEVFKW